jgi:hypothetical protein
MKEKHQMSAKKLGKKIEGTEVIFTIGEEEVRYDTATLPQDIQSRLVPFGCGHKLGDAAASSKTPEESKVAIQRVWEGLMEDKWTTRVPGEPKEKTPKISQKTILENLSKLPADQQEAAKALLASMGISI